MNITDQFRGRDFLTFMDFTSEEIMYMVELAQDLKRKHRLKEPPLHLPERTIAMIFEKQSTRTRFSFQAAIAQLGMHSIFATPETMHLSRGESIKDTARVLDRYCDALILRTYSQHIVEEYAAYMSNPVINALTDLTHPCQGLADMLTIKEYKGKIKDNKLAYIGDPWNVCHTLMICSSLLGMDCYIALPQGFKPAKIIMDFVEDNTKKHGTEVVITDEIEGALKGADIVYANTFHSMGHENIEGRKKAFAKYQINEENFSLVKPNAIFMHCLPAYHGEEMTSSIFEGSQSVVFDQAENRMHTEKAVLSLFITKQPKK